MESWVQINPDGTTVGFVAPKTDQVAKLKVLQSFVGGSVESIKIGGLICFVNEDGRELDLPRNEVIYKKWKIELFGPVIHKINH